MGEAPDQDQLTTDIRDTREDLTANLEALTDKVSPARVVQRRKEATRSRFRSVKDSVMGTASDARGGVADAGSSVTEGVSGAVGTLERRTEGSPLAAGALAFGAGWLLSALLPASEAEARAARQVVEQAKEHGQPVVDEARSVGQDAAQKLKESAVEAAQEVKGTAQESAQNVKEEGASSADTVREDVQSRT